MSALGSIKPSAAERALAKRLRGMLLALMAEGFSESQAIALLGHILVANAIGDA